MRKLIRLQFLQFKRSSSKMEVFGRVYILVCIWLFEVVGILELKSKLGYFRYCMERQGLWCLRESAWQWVWRMFFTNWYSSMMQR